MEIPKLKAIGRQKLKTENAKRQFQSIFGEEPEEESQPLVRDDRKRRTKNLDSFLEELKKSEETKSSEPKLEESYSEPLLASTNLFVGNLPAHVSEADFLHDFALFGPIASIKIMRPRTPEERERGFLNGFVGYMNVSSAESALYAMDGKDWQGKRLHVAWSKPIVIPPQPFYVRSNAELGRPRPAPERSIKVVQPHDSVLLAAIHTVVEDIVRLGAQFEQTVMQETLGDPKYQFLRDFESAEHHYYRWKLHSLQHGGSLSSWHTEPFQVAKDGPVYIPPAIPFRETEVTDDASTESCSDASFSSSDDTEQDSVLVTVEDECHPRFRPLAARQLSAKSRAKYERQLRSLTSYRQNIADAVLFCIDHSEAADELVEILFQSLVIAESETRIKIARLYLLSDLLHNSNVTRTNAWKFRTAIESKLPELFLHLHAVCAAAKSKLKSESIKRVALQLLTIWESWNVFPLPFLNGLRQSFTDRSTPLVVEASLDGMPLGAPAFTAEHLDGEPLDVDGEPLDVAP